MQLALVPLKRFLRLTLLSVPVLLLLIAVLQASESPQAILRAVVGIIAVVGCYEVLLYSAGYTSRIESVILVRFPLGSPSLVNLLEGLSMFILAGATFKLLEYLLQENYPIALAFSVVTAYFLRKLLKFSLKRKSLRSRLTTVALTALAFGMLSSDSDIKYVQSLVTLIEEVVRNAL